MPFSRMKHTHCSEKKTRVLHCFVDVGELRACCTDTEPEVQGSFDQCTASEVAPVGEAVRIETADSHDVPEKVQEVIYTAPQNPKLLNP